MQFLTCEKALCIYSILLNLLISSYLNDYLIRAIVEADYFCGYHLLDGCLLHATTNLLSQFIASFSLLPNFPG